MGNNMEFINWVQMVGFPIAAICALSVALWRVGIYLGKEVLVPVVKRHVSFIDRLEKDFKKSNEDTTDALNTIVDNVASVVSRVDEIAKSVTEVKNLVVRTESVIINPGRGGDKTPPPT